MSKISGTKYNDEMVQVRPRDLPPLIMACYRMRRPLAVFGPPGVGKSAIVEQTAAANGLDFKIEVLANRDAGEVGGLFGIRPVNGKDKTIRTVPEWWPETGTKGILFLDEFAQAMPSVMNVAAQLIFHPFGIGQHRLPAEWVPMIASNRMSDRAATNKIPTHVLGRLVAVELVADPEDVVAHGTAKGWSPIVTSFLNWKPDLISKFDPKSAEPGQPSPRKWETVSLIYAQGLSQSQEMALIQGAVGRGSAAEIMGFAKLYRDLPDPKEVLAKAASFKVPEQTNILYALMGALAAHAKPVDSASLFTFLDRVPQEYAVVCVRDAIRRTPGLKTPSFIKWATKHSDVLID